jgi:uncharacterized membrane protein
VEALYYVVGLILFVFVLWALIDAASKPSSAWEASGQNKTLWIVLLAVGLICGGIVGLIAAIVYLASIRPRVLAAQGGGGPGY